MSFSKDVKEELSKISNLANKDVVKAELIGYLITNNVTVKGKNIKYSTESEYNINRFAKLLNNVNISKYKIDIQGKVFSIEIKQDLNIEELDNVNGNIVLNERINNLCKTDVLQRALVRGSFLGSGTLNNPERIYHLEIIYANPLNMNYIYEILNASDIKMKVLNNSLYLKDGEEISKLLAFIGANSAVLKFEEIRVIRDMKNNVNRMVNCETANLNKTINAALEQIENIKLIKKMNKFHELSPNLQEIAELRLEHPEASLIELGEMLDNPIGKSGVNYRLKAINTFAEELKRS
jgi:hypothetical protein